MKKRFWQLAILFSLFLGSCGVANTSVETSQSSQPPSESDIVTSISDEDLPPVSQESSLSEDTTPFVSVSVARHGQVDSTVVVQGIVGKVWYGTTAVVPQGFYLFDEDAVLFVFGEVSAKTVQLGNQVKVSGMLIYFLLDTDVNGALTYGYDGAIQLSEPTILANDKTIHPIPNGGVQQVRIRDVVNTARTEDLTSTYFEAPAIIEKVQGMGFVTYYLGDVSGNQDEKLLLYTSANGKDHNWLDPYVGQTRVMTFIVHNARVVSDGVWRITPVNVLAQYTPTDSELVDFALDRLLTQFKDKYEADVNLELANSDVQVPNATISYVSNNAGINIVSFEGQLSAEIKITAAVSVEVTITVIFNDVTAMKVATVILDEMPEFDTVSIASARSLASGTDALIQGNILGWAHYGSGSILGFYLGDETSQIVVYLKTVSDISYLSLSEHVVVSGKVTLSTRAGLSLDAAEIVFQDYKVHEVNEDAIETISLTNLLLKTVEDNITSKVYRVNVTITKTTGMYPNIYLNDPENMTGTNLMLYSTGNTSAANPIADDNVGETLDLYVTLISRRQVQDPAPSGDYWRGEVVGLAL
ncbi:MAG TPA: hypothetical protein VJZ31_01960 [Bacilli bacterium]|nr:hypothetical protein [Bacilli bacterium]